MLVGGPIFIFKAWSLKQHDYKQSEKKSVMWTSEKGLLVMFIRLGHLWTVSFPFLSVWRISTHVIPEIWSFHMIIINAAVVNKPLYLCRKLMKAKGPAAAKVEEEKKKGLALFGPKPPTPKLLRALGGTINKTFIDKMKVITPFCPNKCTPSDYYMKVIVLVFYFFPRLPVPTNKEHGKFFFNNPFFGVKKMYLSWKWTHFCWKHLSDDSFTALCVILSNLIITTSQDHVYLNYCP